MERSDSIIEPICAELQTLLWCRDEVRRLQAENDELQKKYNALLVDSIRSQEATMVGMLKLALRGALAAAPAHEAPETEAQQ